MPMLQRSCRQLLCISRARSLAVLRTFASAAPAAVSKKERQPARAEFDLNKLAGPVKNELKFNEEFVEEEGLAVAKVTAAYAEMLSRNEWSVSSKPESTVVELSTQRGDMKVVVRFDAEYVTEALNAGVEDEEAFEEDDAEEARAAEEDMEGEEEGDVEAAQPFEFTVELHRPAALPGKFLELQVEAVPGPAESSDADAVYVNSISVRHTDAALAADAYAGPQVQTLDEELREAFDGWAAKNLRHLVPFIEELAEAKEAEEYGKWLGDVQAFTTKK